MAFWKLHLLGEEMVFARDGRVVALPDIAWSLIGAVMSAPRRRINRGLLAAMLWPDSEDDAARHCLASTLWRLKRRLGCYESLLAVSDEVIAFNGINTIWVDAMAFERRTAAALENPASLDDAAVRAKLRRTLASYRGDFLPSRSNEAIAIERERLRALYLDAGLEFAMACARHDEWRSTLELARTLCSVEPLREDAQRLLMEAYVACGNRAQAVQHYNEFERILDAELGVKPMRETRELAASIARRPQTAAPAIVIPDGQREVLLLARQQALATLSLLDRALAQ